MAKKKFSLEERHAVYTVHGEKCYLCSKALDMQTMEVDHILPESLGITPARLKEVLEGFSLPEDFNLNDFGNWKPTCRPCNGKKLAKVFEPFPIFRMHLDEARAKAGQAAKIASALVERKEVLDALVVVAKAETQGILTEADKGLLPPLFRFQVAVRTPDLAKEPVRITPDFKVISDDGFRQIVRGPYGTGARPSMPNPHPSFDCPNCGAGAAFEGARCVRCGTISDGD